MMRVVFLLMGALFGFLMSRAGASTYDFYVGLFTFQNLQLLWVILSAVATGVIGVWLFQTFNISRSFITRENLSYTGKSMKRTLYFGALIFGVGWGLSGTCPGSAPVMFGEGKFMSLFAIAGILLGTYLYGILDMKRFTLPSASRS